MFFFNEVNVFVLQALYVFMALSLARDEFSWILRHHDNPAPKKANVKHVIDDFVDRLVVMSHLFIILYRLYVLYVLLTMSVLNLTIAKWHHMLPQ